MSEERVYTSRNRTFIYGLSEGGIEKGTPEAAAAIARCMLRENPNWQPGTVFNQAGMARTQTTHPCLTCGTPVPPHTDRCRPCNNKHISRLASARQRTYMHACAKCPTEIRSDATYCRPCYYASRKAPSIEQARSDLADLLTKELV